jgi:hypothetical protein
MQTKTALRPTLPSRSYRRAALAYAVYGCVYLGGAVAALTPDRKTTFFGVVPWWMFYVVGAVLLLALPVLIWREYMWLTRILSLGPAGKALALLWQQGRLVAETGSPDLFPLFFAALAVAAACLLALAGFGAQAPSEKG